MPCIGVSFSAMIGRSPGVNVELADTVSDRSAAVALRG
jgi:hypothetical protein